MKKLKIPKEDGRIENSSKEKVDGASAMTARSNKVGEILLIEKYTCMINLYTKLYRGDYARYPGTTYTAHSRAWMPH